MPDIVSPEVRSRMMAGIKGKDTKPELLFRRALHSLGFRYRLHPKDVPGKPDLVFPKYRAVFFVNGCFWHGHDCHLFKLPDTRREFWHDKIERTRMRDADVRQQLDKAGWRYLTAWECAIRGRYKIGFEQALLRTIDWIRSNQKSIEIRGMQ